MMQGEGLRKVAFMLMVVLGMSSLLTLQPNKVKAEQTATGSFTAMSYNIAALPFPVYLDNSAGNPDPRVRYIGWRTRSFDIIGVQEQLSEIPLFRNKVRHGYFSNNEHLYKYGNGIDLLSKFPMSKTVRVAYNQHPWYIPKGFTMNTIELYPNVFVDVYNTHMGDSQQEITSQVKQLGNYIKNNSPADRAVLVLGDFNARFNKGDKNKLQENLVNPNNLQDCGQLWIGPNGRYPGAYYELVDKVMFRSGTDVKLELTHFEKVSTEGTNYSPDSTAPRHWASHFTKNGKMLSDHKPALAQFNFTVIDEKTVRSDHKVWLSDMKLDYVFNDAFDKGPISADRHVGGPEEGGGDLIKLHGKVYEKGLGVHASSIIEIQLDKKYKLFKSVIGIDDSTKGKGSVKFFVLADGKEVYNSGYMKASTTPKVVSIDVSNVNRLVLKVDKVNTSDRDVADWADAHLIVK